MGPLSILNGEEIAGCFAYFVWCLVIVVWLFLEEPRVCLQVVVVVFPTISIVRENPTNCQE